MCEAVIAQNGCVHEVQIYTGKQEVVVVGCVCVCVGGGGGFRTGDTRSDKQLERKI